MGLDALLETFKNLLFVGAVNNLKPVAKALIFSLAVIDIVLALIMNLGDPDTIKKTCFKILKYCGVVWIVDHFYDIVFTWGLGGFASVAGKAVGIGGNFSPQKIMDSPSIVYKVGIGLASDLIDSMNIWHLGLSFFKLFIGLLIAICFILITVQLFVTMLEFYVCAGMSIIFIPFGVNQHTAFLAQKAQSSLIGFGIKVMFLLFVLSAAMTSCKWKVDADSKTDILRVFGEVACITFLTLKVPQIAAGFMGGSPSQNQNGMGVLGAAKGALSKAAGAAGGMFQAARAGAAGASAGGGKGGTFAAASPKGGGGKSGAATGAATGDGGGGVSGSPTTPNSLAPPANGGRDGAANVGATGDGGGGGSSSPTTPNSLAPPANGGRDGAANVGATGDGGGGGSSSPTTPSSLAPSQGSGKDLHKPYTTYDGRALAPPQGGVKGAEAIKAGAKADEAKKGKFGGALKGIAGYAMMSTSFGKGMRDAEDKMRDADRMKMRLKPSPNESAPQDEDNT